MKLQELYSQSNKYYKTFSKFMKELDKDQKKALLEYKGFEYRVINEILRTNQYPDYTISTLLFKISKHKKFDKNNLTNIFLDIMNEPIKYANALDSVFAKLKSKNMTLSMPLYRGMDIPMPKYKVGSTVSFPEYLSTSMSQSVAYDFQKCGKTPCCIYIFRVNNKIPFIPLYRRLKFENIRAGMDEFELLLPRNTQWKITKKYKATIDPDNTLTCTYEQIEHSKKNKITVYEFSAVKYKQPPVIKELTLDMFEKSMYKASKNSIKNNSDFFTVKNKLALSYLEQ